MNLKKMKEMIIIGIYMVIVVSLMLILCIPDTYDYEQGIKDCILIGGIVGFAFCVVIVIMDAIIHEN